MQPDDLLFLFHPQGTTVKCRTPTVFVSTTVNLSKIVRYDKLISTFSYQNVESLVSSGVQKAIKKIGQGRGGQKYKIYTRRDNGAGFGDKANFYTFRRHDCAIWLSSTFHYVV